MIRVLFILLLAQASYCQTSVRFNYWVPALPSASNLTGATVPIVQGGVSKQAAATLFTGGAGISNSALNNELMMSNGTNAISSGLFADAAGNINLGTSLSGSSRTISATGGSSNIDLIFQNKGAGNIFGFNTTSGSALLQAGGAATLLNIYGNGGINLNGGTTTSGYVNLSINTDASKATVSTTGNLLIQPVGYTSVTGTFVHPPVTLTTISTTQNNYNIGSGTIFLVDASGGTQQITGITNGIAGRLLIIRNTGSTNIINFNHEDAGSTAGNRIHSSTGSTLNLNPGKVIMLFYDSSLSRYVDISF